MSSGLRTRADRKVSNADEQCRLKQVIGQGNLPNFGFLVENMLKLAVSYDSQNLPLDRLISDIQPQIQ